MDTIIEKVLVNGKQYRLQHPGMRAVLKLQRDCLVNDTGITDIEQIVDYCFQHVVFPEGHSFRPTLDTIVPSECDDWITIFVRFLRHGSLEGFCVLKEGNESSEEESRCQLTDLDTCAE